MSPPLYAAKGMCSTRAGRTTALHPMRFELESQSHDLAPWCIRSRPCCVGARYALVEPQVNRDVRPISSDLRLCAARASPDSVDRLITLLADRSPAACGLHGATSP